MIDVNSISKITKHPFTRKVMTMLNARVPEFGYFLTFLVSEFKIIDRPDAPALMWVQHSFDKNVCVFNLNDEMFHRYFPHITDERDKVAAYGFVTLHEILHLMSGHLSKKRRNVFSVLHMSPQVANVILDEFVNEMIIESFELSTFSGSEQFSKHVLDRLVTKEKVVSGLNTIVRFARDTKLQHVDKIKELVEEYKELKLLDSIEKRAVIIAKILELLKQDIQQQMGGNSNNKQQQGQGQNQQGQGQGQQNQQNQNGQQGQQNQQGQGQGQQNQQNQNGQGQNQGSNGNQQQNNNDNNGSGGGQQQQQDQDDSGGGYSDANSIVQDLLRDFLEEAGSALSQHDANLDDEQQQVIEQLQRQAANVVKNRSAAYKRFEELIGELTETDDELSRYLHRLAKGIGEFRSRIANKLAYPIRTFPDIPRYIVNKRYMPVDEGLAWLKRKRKEKPAQFGVNIYIDVSGSISDTELKVLLRNFNHVAKMYAGKTNLYCWSSLPDDPQFIGEYKPGNDIAIEKLPSGGGTSMNPVIHYIVEHDDEFKNFIHVILTDGWVESDLEVLPPKIGKRVFIGLTDEQVDTVKGCNPGFVFVFRRKDDKHI